MTDQQPPSLQKVLQSVKAGANAPENLESLAKAFELFAQETQQLERNYADLKKEYSALKASWENSQQSLQAKLIELNDMAYYLNNLVDHLAQGLLFIDFTGSMTSYNPAAEKLLGIPKEKAMYQNFWSLFDDSLLGFSMRDALSHPISQGTSFAIVAKPDGTRRELEVEYSSISKADASAAMRGMIVLLRDVTELRRLQAIANRHDRLEELGEMAALLAHEIRNPLGGIKGFASLLQRDLKDHPEQQKLVNYIVEGTDNLNILVTNVLNYARPSQPKIVSTNLVELINHIKEHLQADQAFNPMIDISIESSQPALNVPIDPDLFRVALLNLMVNALQAMAEGGTLTLKIISDAHEARLDIIDTGSGIAPEHMKRLFTPFFTTKPAGNGFGLAEVMKIVQAHGGKIDVASTVGKGTTFTIIIPLK